MKPSPKKIPSHYIRLIHNNTEVQNYTTKDINWLRLKNNDVIDIKLRLKGGMDRQFDMDIETEGEKRLKELHNALLETQEYTTSITTEKRDGESKFVDLSSDTIYKSLEHIPFLISFRIENYEEFLCIDLYIIYKSLS